MTENGDYWNGKSVLVTGCSGMVGSWLTAELANRGARVVGLVRDHVANSNLFRMGTDAKIDIVRGDVCDRDLCARALNEYEVDTLFHLAHQHRSGWSFEVDLRPFTEEW